MGEFSDVLKNALRSGEEILWQGKPSLKNYLKRGLTQHLAYIVFLADLLYVSSWQRFSLTNIFTLMFLIGLFLVAIPPLKMLFILKKTNYVLTDKRALVFLPSIMAVDSLDTVVNATQLIRADGAASIVFRSIDKIPRGFLWLQESESILKAIDKVKTNVS